MFAKNCGNIFGSFIDIQQNAEWPRFWPTRYAYWDFIVLGLVSTVDHGSTKLGLLLYAGLDTVMGVCLIYAHS